MEENETVDEKIQEQKRKIEALINNLQKEKKCRQGRICNISNRKRQEDYCVAQSLLADGNKCLSVALKKRDSKDIKVANKLLSSAQKKIEALEKVLTNLKQKKNQD